MAPFGEVTGELTETIVRVSLRAKIATALALREEQVDPDATLTDLGVTLVSAARIQNVVRQDLAVVLPADVLFGQVSVREIQNWCLGQLGLAVERGSEVQPARFPAS